MTTLSSITERSDSGPLPPHPEVTWRTDPVVLAAHRYDRSGWEPDVLPSTVASVTGAAGVAHVLRHATATRTPVVARGGGTGVAGAATAPDGGFVLDLTPMNRIVEVSVDDAVAVVEPGVITADLDRAARAQGLRYAPDPASVEISTIGGNIATNAGGLHCAKYGVTRDAVLGLDVVLADGRLIRTGRRAVKGVVGYDLTGLFVGSEGTLGVVVAATVRLRPLPAATATVSAFFADAGAAFAAMATVHQAGVVPAVAEFIDGATLRRLDAYLGGDLASRGDAFLLLQTDGSDAAAQAEHLLRQIQPRATSVQMTTDPEEARQLTAVRRNALPALEAAGRVLIEDISVPRSQLPAAVAAVTELARTSGVQIHSFAHAADGNLHPILVLGQGQSPGDPVVQAAADELFRLALALGGTITGEHGVGVLKREWMRRELGEDVVALQRQIKAAFDPAGILNPGKAV